MTKRVLLPLAILVGAILFCAGTNQAFAQANVCCNFRVIANMTIPAACFPIPIQTSWGLGAVVQNDVVTVNGSNPFVIAGCPPIPTPFDWVSLNGGVTTIPFNTPTNFILPCGTCVKVIVGYDTGVPACIVIRLTIC